MCIQLERVGFRGSRDWKYFQPVPNILIDVKIHGGFLEYVGMSHSSKAETSVVRGWMFNQP
jgi:hypothetical protein